MKAPRNLPTLPHVSPRRRARPIISISDLSLRNDEVGLDRFRRMFEIDRLPTAGLSMSNCAWPETINALKAPREIIEQQILITVRDLYLKHESIFNPLRSRRVSEPVGLSPTELIDQERDSMGCRRCDLESRHVHRQGMWV